MNLQQALATESLSHRIAKEECPCEQPRVSALQLAKKVFKMAASRGEPFRGQTPESWARKWLASKEFVLMEVQAASVAATTSPYNRNRVLEHVYSATDMMDPILVDLNKRGTGSSPRGFIPKVIIVDGKHRAAAHRIHGRETYKAWVGAKALPFVTPSTGLEVTVTGSAPVIPVMPSRIDAVAQLHAGMNMTPVPRQDVGDGGSAPTGRPAIAGSPSGSKFIKDRGVKADASDTKSAQDPSDEGWPPDASDRKDGVDYSKANQTRTNTSQMNDVPAKGSVYKIPASPSAQSPGGDAGFRFPSKGATRSENAAKASDGGPSGMGTGRNKGGATRSELTKVMGKGKEMDCDCPGKMKGKHLESCKGMRAGLIPGKIKTKQAKMKAKTAPGWEGTVKKMKDHPEIDNPYALTNWMDEEGYEPGGSDKKKK